MNMNKTVEDRILETYRLAEEYYGEGEVNFVGVKFVKSVGWVAKISFVSDNYSSLTGVDATNAKMALKNLRNRLRKIIKRRDLV